MSKKTTKLLVVSDNHGVIDDLQQLVAKFKLNVDAMIHCGDSLLQADSKLLQDFICVRGNCDYDDNFLPRRIVNIAGHRILVTHGNLEAVGMGMNKLSLFAQKNGVELVCFGHTHQQGVVSNHNIVYLNPGSLNFPRGKYQKLGGSAAIVTFSGLNIHVQFIDRRGNSVTGLGFDFKKFSIK